MHKQPCVYILASKKNGTLYIGVISNLLKRLESHHDGLGNGFTSKYGVRQLVYVEFHDETDLPPENQAI